MRLYLDTDKLSLKHIWKIKGLFLSKKEGENVVKSEKVFFKNHYCSLRTSTKSYLFRTFNIAIHSISMLGYVTIVPPWCTCCTGFCPCMEVPPWSMSNCMPRRQALSVIFERGGGWPRYMEGGAWVLNWQGTHGCGLLSDGNINILVSEMNRIVAWIERQSAKTGTMEGKRMNGKKKKEEK